MTKKTSFNPLTQHIKKQTDQKTTIKKNDADELTLLQYSEPANSEIIGKKTVTARRPHHTGVGSACCALPMALAGA